MPTPDDNIVDNDRQNVAIVLIGSRDEELEETAVGEAVVAFGVAGEERGGADFVVKDVHVGEVAGAIGEQLGDGAAQLQVVHAGFVGFPEPQGQILG